jgi:hypothetical protein
VPVTSPADCRRDFVEKFARSEAKMGLAQYAIVPVRGQWGVLHDGEVNGEYATKEAAFESAVAAASTAMRQGHEVHVSAPARVEAKDE